MQAVAGIFVGGRARRMGGRPKGNLPARGGATILERLRSACEAAGVEPVLVGDAPSREPYAASGLTGVDDDPRAEGPLAGLVGLLSHVKEGAALALACDMPFVTGALLRRLRDDPSEAPVVAARRDGRWEPFLARYDARKVLPVALGAARAGRLGLQSLLEESGARPLAMTREEAVALVDWDTPEDVAIVGGSA